MVLLLKSKDVFTLTEAESENDFTWKTASTTSEAFDGSILIYFEVMTLSLSL